MCALEMRWTVLFVIRDDLLRFVIGYPLSQMAIQGEDLEIYEKTCRPIFAHASESQIRGAPNAFAKPG